MDETISFEIKHEQYALLLSFETNIKKTFLVSEENESKILDEWAGIVEDK